MLLYICNKKKERINTMEIRILNEKEAMVEYLKTMAEEMITELYDYTQLEYFPEMTFIEYAELFTEIFLDTIGNMEIIKGESK